MTGGSMPEKFGIILGSTGPGGVPGRRFPSLLPPHQGRASWPCRTGLHREARGPTRAAAASRSRPLDVPRGAFLPGNGPSRAGRRHHGRPDQEIEAGRHHHGGRTSLPRRDAPFQNSTATSLEKLAAQARLQCQTRADRTEKPDAPPRYELLPQTGANGEPVGLAALPPDHPADVFFDMEGYPLAPGGLEYLFGVCHANRPAGRVGVQGLVGA